MKSWEDIFCTAKELAATAGRKAGDIADAAKTKMKIAENERATTATLEALGRLFYDSRAEGAELNEETVEELVNQVKELTAANDELQAQLDSAMGRKVCPDCGKVNPENAAYCNHCGKEL